MKLIELLKNLRKKYIKKPKKLLNKELIEILELILEKEFFKWNYFQELSKPQVILAEKLSKLVFKYQFPLQYLKNTLKFSKVELYINPFTLIPRPETELIIEKIYFYLTQKEILLKNKKTVLIDFGTGSGNIILSLLKFINTTKVISLAIDISFNALQVAYKNSLLNNIEETLFINTQNLEILKPNNDYHYIIVSNPPYLVKKELKKELFFEPLHALLTPNKTFFYKEIIKYFIKNSFQKFAIFFEIDKKSLFKLTPFLYKNNFHFYSIPIHRNIFLLIIDSLNYLHF